MMFSTHLTVAQTERLALLQEEMNEAGQIICKILRHGYYSDASRDYEAFDNQELLEKELGDLMYALNLMISKGDVSAADIAQAEIQAAQRKKRFLHFQEE